MKRGTKLLALVLTLGLLAGAAFYVSRMNLEGNTPAASDVPSVTVYTANRDSISRIAWTVAEQTHTLSRKNDKWSYVEDPNLPLDDTVTVSMLNALDEILASKTIEAPEDLSQFGLDAPELIIDVTAKTQTRFLVGTTNMDGQRYLMMEGDSNVYLVHPAIGSSFQLGLFDLVKEEGIPDMSQTEALHVTTQTQSYDIVYLEGSGRDYSDSYVWFMETADGWKTLDTELTQEFLSSLAAVRWIECVDYYADETELAKYGLDNPAATYTANYVQVSSGKEVRRTFSLELGGYSGSQTYARIVGSDLVYLIDGSISDTLLYTDADDLRPDEVLVMDFATVEAIDFTADGQTIRAERSTRTETDAAGTVTEKNIWLLNGKEVALGLLLPELNNLVSSGYADGVVPERDLLVGMVFYRNTQTHERVELRIYEYNSTESLVTFNGESRLFIPNEEADSAVGLVQGLIAGLQKNQSE